MIGGRLKEERERLELTQPSFAEAAGAKKRTVIDWEKGVSSPTAVQLAALAAVGVDALYVLTGTRLATHVALGHLRTASEAAGQLGGTDSEKAAAAEALFNQLNK